MNALHRDPKTSLPVRAIYALCLRRLLHHMGNINQLSCPSPCRRKSLARYDGQTRWQWRHLQHCRALFTVERHRHAPTLSGMTCQIRRVGPRGDDGILGEEADPSDPFVEYVFLGEDISDGILAWIGISIDPTSNQEITSAATRHKDGGVANENGWMPGAGPPSGTMIGYAL